MQRFDQHSPTTMALLEDPRFLAIAELTGDGVLELERRMLAEDRAEGEDRTAARHHLAHPHHRLSRRLEEKRRAVM